MARTSSSDGTEIAYRTAGEGEPVVFVHGTATSSADWALVVPHLEERFTVVSMDRRGRGRSGDAAEYAMEREAEDVLAVLEAVGAELLVGHSYGALCSILAAERTDRLRRLVLYEPPIAVREQWLEGLEDLVEQGEHAAALEGFLRGAGVPDQQVELIRGSPAWPVLLDAVPPMAREMRAAARWRHPAGPIDVPTLYLTGGDTDGPAYLTGAEDLQARFSDLRAETLPGQRHIAHVLAAEHFARTVSEFIEASG